MQTGRRNDVQPRLLRDARQTVEVAAETDRRPVDECTAAGFDKRARLRNRLLDVGELVAWLRRRDEEEMLVGVARTEVARVDVAAHRPDDHAPILRRSARVSPGGILVKTEVEVSLRTPTPIIAAPRKPPAQGSVSGDDSYPARQDGQTEPTRVLV